MKRLLFLKCPLCGARRMYFDVKPIYTADPIDYPVEPEIICKSCGAFREYIRCWQDDVKRAKELLVKQVKLYYREETRRRA